MYQKRVVQAGQVGSILTLGGSLHYTQIQTKALYVTDATSLRYTQLVAETSLSLKDTSSTGSEQTLTFECPLQKDRSRKIHQLHSLMEISINASVLAHN